MAFRLLNRKWGLSCMRRAPSRASASCAVSRAAWVSRSRASVKKKMACSTPRTAKYTATPKGRLVKNQPT